MPPLAFLVPAFLVGLAAIVIPVLVHLTRRQRAKILRFPSLMFLEKVPYKAESRRQIHHWVLLLMRALAVALLVAAFARPFFVRESDAGAASGPREVVILLDQSYSMGVGDHWERGVAAAQGVIDELGPLDRASLVLFARSASVLARSTGDRVRLRGALDTIRVSSEATSYGPGLKLAETILDESELPSGELVLISDFQRPGWTGEEGVSLPVGSVVTPIPLAGQPPENLAIAGVTLTRQVSLRKRARLAHGTRDTSRRCGRPNRRGDPRGGREGAAASGDHPFRGRGRAGRVSTLHDFGDARARNDSDRARSTRAGQ